MSFTLPDLVIEGAIRKGFDFLRNNAGKDASPNIESDDLINISRTTPSNVFDPLPSTSGDPETASLILDGFQPVVGTLGRFSRVSDGQIIEFAIGDQVSSIAFETSTPGVGPSVGQAGPIVQLISATAPDATRSIFTFSFDVLTVNSNWVNFINNADGNVTFTMAGTFINEEIIGGGGEILNMLFDFRTGSDSIDGGLDSVISRKYSLEPIRLREFFRRNQIAIVQSFSDVQAHLPCISIQLANDGEDQGLALTDDFGGIDGTFDSDVPARDRLGRDENTIHANTTVNVGIHTKEQLLTKYLYHITKYFILSAKEDLIRQNFIIATFKGSDFTRDSSWQGDHVYTRFLNISGKTEDSWVNLDEIVIALEEVGVQVFVSGNEGQVTGNNFVSGSSIFSNITNSSPMFSLPNSVYFPDVGKAVVIQRDGTGAQLFQSKEFDITANNELTGVLTAANFQPAIDNDNNAVTYQIINGSRDANGNLVPENDRSLGITNLATGQTVPIENFSQTFSTPPPASVAPDGLVRSQSRQNINDADGVLHRSNINEGTIPST